MPETAQGYLNRLLLSYTPALDYFASAKKHRRSIENRINQEIGLKEMFETGSLGHGTGVTRYSDADYIVSLKGNRPNSIVASNRLKTVLQGRFSGTTIKVRRPAVVCEFAKGAETVEIVPAYSADSGYWIPDPTGGWMRAHPKAHNSYVNRVNQKHSGGAKKLARLGKIWKYERNVYASSCYFEMRAAKYADEQKSWTLTAKLWGYFRMLQVAELASMNDPTGLGSRFTACSSDCLRSDSISKLARAVSRAEKAKDYASSGRHSLAIEQYKLLFNQ